MWRNWNPLNPPINEQSSDEDQFQSPPENDLNELVSPNRPHQSASASPRALLRPDPPQVEEVLDQVGQRLRQLPNREQRVANRAALREAQEAAEAAAAEAAAAAANMPNPPPVVVDFDVEDTEDSEKAAETARHIKVEFDQSDIRFWFAELEDEMLLAGVHSQWLKKSVLQRNLPVKQKEDVKSLLVLPRAQAGSIYLTIKNELVRIYAPKPSDAYKKALSRTMVGLPSQLGQQIIDDVCKKPQKLVGCCCAGAVEALWSLQLPVQIRAHISNMEFSAGTFKSVFEAADQVYLSSQQVQIAAVATPRSLDETLPAFSAQNQPQVAAVSSKKNNKGNNGGGGNGGGNGGGKNNKNNKPKKPRSQMKKHSSVPDAQADKMCDRHFVHGDSAWYCLAPSTCPWVNRVTPK